MGSRSVGTLRRIRRRAGAWEDINGGRALGTDLRQTLQTGERQGRTDHGEMQRADERKRDQGNMHGG